VDDFLKYLTLPYLWQGAVIAMQLFVGALAGGVIIGFFLALASASRHAAIRLPVQAYIYILRGTPVLLQLILLYNVLPQFGLRLSPFVSALLALMINETAFCAEIIRGGIMATDRDQRVAAQAFGYSRTKEMIHVVIPQALRAILPTMGNEAIGLLKSTSLASVVGVNEITMRGQTIVSQNFLFIPVLVASGAIYMIISSLMATGQWWLERYYNLEDRARRARVRQDNMPQPADVVAMKLPKQRWDISNAATVLEIDHLCVEYGNKPVLKDLSLHIRRGEVVVLLGRSGSGKSTLLKAILALTPRTSGRIATEGHVMGYNDLGRPLPDRHLPQNRARSGIGIVFQHFALFEHLTVLENVMSIPLRVQGEQVSIARTKALRALGVVGLGDFTAALPHELSGGQQQRVGIARALAAEPRILLFDEPTSALDPELVREVNQAIRSLAQTGITMIISTHDIAFAASVADRVVFLQNGQLVEQGAPVILQRPQSADFAAFLQHEHQENQHA